MIRDSLLHRLPLALLSLLLVHAAAVQAQVPSDTAHSDPSERVWASLGLGAGTGSTFAGVIGGWYTRGAFAIAAQYSEVQPFWSADRHSSAALLLGARTSHDGVFLVGGIGPAVARFQTDCKSRCPLHQVGSQPLVLGFSGQAVVNARVLGLALGPFGALGPRRVSYAGLALSLALGWFGN